MSYSSVSELIKIAKNNNTSIAELIIRNETEDSDMCRNEIERKMKHNLNVMIEAVQKGRKNILESESGLTGGDAVKLINNNIFPDGLYKNTIINALAVAEVNACMGKIVASPTAGSSGIVPAVLLALKDHYKLSNKEICHSLFTAAGLGSIVAQKATLAGAAGGCQAECGVAAAMAAGAGVELMKGNPDMVGAAFSLALKNMLGLVCDPVAGLVEVPCVKRNAFSATHALTAIQMALAGIESVIPPDEVIEAMSEIGDLLPTTLKETSLAGLACTPTGLVIKDNLK